MHPLVARGYYTGRVLAILVALFVAGSYGFTMLFGLMPLTLACRGKAISVARRVASLPRVQRLRCFRRRARRCDVCRFIASFGARHTRQYPGSDEYDQFTPCAFPFKVNVRQAMASSPLTTGEHVSVIGLAHKDLCRVGIFVWVRWGERDVVAPLAQIVPLSGDKPTRVAVADWHYWHDQGYTF